MNIFLSSKRRKVENIKKAHPHAVIVDVTSKGPLPWAKFSPFYPQGGIPVLFSAGVFAESVEGIWQGLKVFETTDIDVARFEITKMKGLKRTVRRFGKVLGHRRGVFGDELLSYGNARYQIYLPVYKWVLENRLQNEVKELKQLAQKQDVVLLDYETNSDVDNLAKPLSHASLIIKYLEGAWPPSDAV